MAILDLLAEAGSEGASVSGLSDGIGVSSSTVHHILSTLRERDIVEQDSSSRKYRLGIHLVRLGNVALQATSVPQVARPYLERISEETGRSVSLLAFHGLLRTPMTGISSSRPLVARHAPLRVSTLHATGSGKLLLAHLPKTEFEHYLRQAQLVRFSASTITDPDDLEAELEQIRAEGISYDREEYGEGVACVAAPVRDATLKVVGCLDLVFPTTTATEDEAAQFADAVRDAASELSDQLQDIGLTASYGVEPYAHHTQPLL